MKEATGELSTTAIAIVAIGLILAIFTTILLPTIRSQIALNQACNSGPNYNVKNDDGSTIVCSAATGTIGNRQWTCTYTPKDGTQGGAGSATKTCKDK